jgi:hypothetical protein
MDVKLRQFVRMRAAQHCEYYWSFRRWVGMSPGQWRRSSVDRPIVQVSIAEALPAFGPAAFITSPGPATERRMTRRTCPEVRSHLFGDVQ